MLHMKARAVSNILSMAEALNMPRLRICQGSECASSSKYARDLNTPFRNIRMFRSLKYKKVPFPEI